MKAEKHHFLFLAFLLLLPGLAMADSRGIQVSGKAKVSVVPDMATFTFAIEGRGQELAAVKKDIDIRTAKLVRLSKSTGVDTKNITATEISIRPQYDYQNKTFIAYAVSRTVNVTLTNLDNYSALVSGAIDAGITTIRSIVVDTSRRDDLLRDALQAAVQDAREKAQIIARGADVELGRVVNIVEGGMPVEAANYRLLGAEAARVDGSAVVEPGEISITAMVTVTFSLD
jgi:uncharacterized protein YggE